MGKRELVIIAGFAVAGTLLYVLLAPPPAPETGPGIDNLTEIWNPRNPSAGRASVSTSGTFALPADLDEIRLADIGTLELRGEARADLAWTLTAEAAADDQASAERAAETASVRHDDVGRVVSVGVRRPDEAIRASRLELAVPHQVRLRLESARETLVEDVAAVRLENLAGTATLRRIEDSVEGSQRNGSLTIDGAGHVTLTLSETTATLRAIEGNLALNARNGATTIEEPRGVTAVETIDQRLTVVDAVGPIRGSARGGTVVIERPHDVIDFDVRRVELAITLGDPVPVMLFARNATVTITLPPEGDVILDVIAEDGTIDASAVGLTPHEGQSEQTLSAGTTGPRLAIRTQETTVVIRPGK